MTGPESILISHGLGLVFQRVILQGNAGASFRLEPGWSGARIDGIVVRDTWMEKNGGGEIVGSHAGAATREGTTRTW